MYSKPFKRVAAVVAIPTVLLSAAVSHAQIVGELWQNVGGNAGNATIANAPGTSPDAEFNPAAINFNSNVSGYTPATFLNGPTFFNTSGSFNPNGTLNNTYFLFTGQTFLHAGANSFVTPHDDGFELSIPGASFDLSQPGPTSPVNTPYTVNAPHDGLYSFTLSYGEVQGPPAVLAFEINGAPVGNVPEACSTCGLLGTVAGMLALVHRKMRRN